MNLQNFLLTLILGSSTLAHAAPSIGSYVEYKHVTSGMGMVYVSHELIEVIAYNPKTEDYTLRSTYTPISGSHVDDGVEVDEYIATKAELERAQDEAVHAFANCERLGGWRATLWVDSKKMKTCRIITVSNASKETTWYAPGLLEGFAKYKASARGWWFNHSTEVLSFKP